MPSFLLSFLYSSLLPQECVPGDLDLVQIHLLHAFIPSFFLPLFLSCLPAGVRPGGPGAEAEGVASDRRRGTRGRSARVLHQLHALLHLHVRPPAPRAVHRRAPGQYAGCTVAWCTRSVWCTQLVWCTRSVCWVHRELCIGVYQVSVVHPVGMVYQVSVLGALLHGAPGQCGAPSWCGAPSQCAGCTVAWCTRAVWCTQLVWCTRSVSWVHH